MSLADSDALSSRATAGPSVSSGSKGWDQLLSCAKYTTCGSPDSGHQSILVTESHTDGFHAEECVVSLKLVKRKVNSRPNRPSILESEWVELTSRTVKLTSCMQDGKPVFYRQLCII